ncbi:MULTISPECIES: hypothetical protein [unclassified Kitasatospora]|uniref:hypothetical protein n=1 Tax=unclassified Kitasatospora TaxID=2633591 RepID=UPI00247692F1|nr:hypothetical protein [Kitasatospora sp. MAP12-44]
MADSPFGPIRISHDSWPSVIALVQGEGMPAVTVRPGRDNGGGMSVNGRRVTTSHRTGRRWDPRRAARTRTALVGDRGYELRPTGVCRSQILRNGTPVAEARGTLLSYSPFHEIPGIDARLTWSPGVDPTDVAIGQAMVVAFGAGAPGALTTLAFFWLDFIN